MTNEEKDNIIYALEYACSEKSDSISRPFIRGDYIYATTGSVIVRRLLKEEDKTLFAEYEARENAPSQESMERLFDNPQSGETHWLKTANGIVWSGLVECWKKHCNTQHEELRNLEHYTCPCCDNRVYLDGDTLVDEDTAKRTLITRYGIEVKVGDGKLTFAGKSVYDAVVCVGQLGTIMDFEVRDRDLKIIGLGFDCLIAARPDPLFPESEPKTEIVGTFELEKENE